MVFMINYQSVKKLFVFTFVRYYVEDWLFQGIRREYNLDKSFL